MSHTPTPWEARECGDFGGWGIIAVEPMRGRVDSQITGMTEANARLIVRAVNAFEPMREALKLAKKNLQFLPPDDVVEQIDAALALAEKEKP